MNNSTFLSLSAVDAVTGMLHETVTGTTSQAILNQWVNLTVDAPNSQVTATSRAISKDGLVGQYIGTVTFPYEKRDLNLMLPFPFVLPLDYPTTFVMVATYMQEHYGIFLEDGEFSVDGNSIPGALSGTDTIDVAPDAQTGYVTLRAQPTSGRFTTDSLIQLLLTSPTVKVPLKTLLKLDSKLDLHLLTDH